MSRPGKVIPKSKSKEFQYTVNFFFAINLNFHIRTEGTLQCGSIKLQTAVFILQQRCNIFLLSIAFHCCFLWQRSSHRCQLSQRYTSTARWDCVRAEIESQCLDLCHHLTVLSNNRILCTFDHLKFLLQFFTHNCLILKWENPQQLQTPPQFVL